MLNRIDENNFKEDVKIKDYYESFYKDDKTFIDYYNEAATICSVDSNKIYLKAMSSLVYPSQIKDEYNPNQKAFVVCS